MVSTSRGEYIIHLPRHVANFPYSLQVQGYEGSTDVKVVVGVLPKACCHLQVVLSLSLYSVGYGYEVWGCKSSVLKHWGICGFIEFKSLLKDCLYKGFPPLNSRGDLYHQVSGPNQNLPSDTSWIQVRLLCATGKKKKNIYSCIHSHTFIMRRGLLYECMRLWSSLKSLIDHVACRTWQASWADWRKLGEGHLHVETALSHWGHEGSHSATLAWPRQYMSLANQAEQQIPHLLQT